MLILDHIAVACTSLEEGTAWVQDRLGVVLQQGGQHPLYGTHNMLLGLADGLYLEVIAKDPDAHPEAGHSWFDLDRFYGAPRMANWICQTENIAAAPKVGKSRLMIHSFLIYPYLESLKSDINIEWKFYSFHASFLNRY